MIKILALGMFLSLCAPLVAAPPVWVLPANVYVNPDESICGKIWKNEHSICKGAAVVALANEDAAEINIAVSTIKQEMDNLAFKLANPDSRASMLSYRDLAFYGQISDEGQRKTMGLATDRCANYLTRVRAAALCFACSGRQEDYFFGSKAIIKDGQCTDMLRECLDFYRYSVTIVQGMADLGRTLNRTASNWKGQDQELISTFSKAFTVFIKKIHNAKLGEILLENTSSSSAAPKICARLFMLRKVSFIKIMAYLISFVNRTIDGFLKTANTLESRELHSSPEFEFTEVSLEGDTAILLPREQKLILFDGAPSSVQLSNPFSRSMNLSICFP